MRRRVVVSGIGAVTPIGSQSEGLWCGVLAGKSKVAPVSRFDASTFRSRIAAEVHGFDPTDWMESRTARRLDRFAQFAVAAARQSIDDAALPGTCMDRHKTGVSVGSALGGIAYGEEQHDAFLRSGLKAVRPTLAIAVYGGAGAANIAHELDIRGPNLSNANSCASGAIAIGEAMRLIQRDEVDVMLAGGVEAPLAPLTFGSFSLIKALSTRNDAPETASRPFDAERDGFVMAEGAAIVVLEERGHALRRGARIYAELLGYAQTNDAYHMTAPRPDGEEAARAISLALRDSQVAHDEIGYVNAHATGTLLGDVAEGRALHLALGAHGAQVPVSSTKGLYGHALGASGAMEVAITSLALQRHFLPGNINLFRAAEQCVLRLVPPAGIACRVDRAVSTSFGFGGTNAALVLGQYEETGFSG